MAIHHDRTARYNPDVCTRLLLPLTENIFIHLRRFILYLELIGNSIFEIFVVYKIGNFTFCTVL